MEDIRQDSIAAFDAQFTNNHIRMLKVLLRFLDPSMQKGIAVYIKFLELQYTMQVFRPFPHGRGLLPGAVSKESPFDFDSICDELLPYCSTYEKQQFTQMRSMLQTMHNLQSMMEMMETLKELFPEGMGNGDQGGFHPEMLAAMSSMFGGGDMDLSAMAEMFSGGS